MISTRKKVISMFLVFTALFSLVLTFPMKAYGVTTIEFAGIPIKTDFVNAVGTILDNDGNVYVADYGSGKITKMSSEGKNVINFASGLDQPLGMVFDKSGNLYVAEHRGSKVIKINPSGNVTTISTTPDAGSRYGLLTGITIDSNGYLYVADFRTGKIFKMNADGSNVTTFVSGLPNTSLIGMTIDSNDNIYIADRTQNAIKKIDPSKNITTFGSGFSNPQWITIGKDGYFYVADTGNRLIKKLDSNGNTISSFSTGSYSPWGVGVSNSGYIYFSSITKTLYQIVGSAIASDKTHIILNMNNELSGNIADPEAFTLHGITSNPVVSNAVVSGSNITLTLSSPISAIDNNIKVDYKRTGKNNLTSSVSKVQLEEFSNLSVSNKVAFINPSVGSFDKYGPKQAAVVATMILNGNDLNGITNGGTPLVANIDYTVLGNTLTIKKEYLAKQSVGTMNLILNFSLSGEQPLEVNITETIPKNSIISPSSASFDKNTSLQKDIKTTMSLNENTLSSITNEGILLVLNNDYTVSGNEVTIKKEYLAKQDLGIINLTFNFNEGNVQNLAIQITNHYIVTFKDYDGKTIGDTQMVENGQSAVAPTAPAKEGYTFTGWEKNFDNVTEDLEVKAKYEINHYKISFKDYDGKEIGTEQSIEYGKSATAPVAPAKEGYTFIKWDKDFDVVKEDLVVNAIYGINHYKVSFKDYDGKEIGTEQSIEYGKSATVPVVPAKEGYTFIKWDKAVDAVKEDLVVNAIYGINHYKVSFKDYDGKEIGTEQSIEYGESATVPVVAAKEGYTFIKWDKAFDAVKEDLVVNAIYGINHYKISFKDYDGKEIGTEQSIDYGKSAVAPTEPTRIGYKFLEWDKTFNNVTSDLVVTAKYTTGITYTMPVSEKKDGKEVKCESGYFTSGENTIVVKSEMGSLNVPTNIITQADMQGVDYIKISQTKLDENSEKVLTENLPSDIKVKKILDLRVELFDYKDTLIKNIHQFANNQKVKVCIKLTSEEIKNVDTDKLSMYYYDEVKKEWVELGGSFDKDSMEFVYDTPHFTKFAIMEKQKTILAEDKKQKSEDKKQTDALIQTGSPIGFDSIVRLSGLFIISGVFIIRRRK